MIGRRGSHSRKRHGASAFDKIVASLVDPEWRRERRTVLLIFVAVLAGAMVVLLLVPSRSREFIGFAVAFAIGIVVDLAVLRRRFRRRR